MWELWGVEISAFPLTWHIAYTTACCYRSRQDKGMKRRISGWVWLRPILFYWEQPVFTSRINAELNTNLVIITSCSNKKVKKVIRYFS